MDMSTPPSPILKATSPSIAPVENATTHHAVPSSIDINASELDVLKLTSTVPKSPEAPGVGSAVSDDSTIPGLSLAAGDVREPGRYDNHTGPNTASTAQKDEPSFGVAYSSFPRGLNSQVSNLSHREKDEAILNILHGFPHFPNDIHLQVGNPSSFSNPPSWQVCLPARSVTCLCRAPV